MKATVTEQTLLQTHNKTPNLGFHTVNGTVTVFPGQN